MEFVREDDYVEYFIFPNIKTPSECEQEDSGEQSEAIKQELLDFQGKCMQFVAQMVDSTQFIWHKDDFQLVPRVSTKEERLLYDDFDYEDERTEAPSGSKISSSTNGGSTKKGKNTTRNTFKCSI